MNEEFLINLWIYRKKMYLCSVLHKSRGKRKPAIDAGYYYACMYAVYTIFGYLTPCGEVNAHPTASWYVERRAVGSRFSTL